MNLIPIHQACGGRSFPRWGVALAGFALLAFVSISQAQITVTTIGGGVRKGCGASYGFAEGDTLTQSQFHIPFATALDSLGNLWVADLDNSDFEEITEAGNATSSVTKQYGTGAGAHQFVGIIGVAVDAGNNLYVLTKTKLFIFDDAPASFPTLSPVPSVPAKGIVLDTLFPAAATGTAIVVANDANTNIFISCTNVHGGTIIRLPQPYAGAGSASVVVENYRFNPVGLCLRPDGLLGVSDLLSNSIYAIATNNSSTPIRLTGGHGTGKNGQGFINGSSNVAAFYEPRGIAASADGSMVVCDSLNNCLRVIDTNNNTTNLYGTPSSVWTKTCCSCSPPQYAGWVDGTAGSGADNASSREPLSVTIAPGSSNYPDGALFVTEGYYDLLRSVTGTGLTPVNPPSPPAPTNSASLVTLQASNITASSAVLNASLVPAGSETQVYFEWGLTTNYGSNTAPTTLTTNLFATNVVSASLTGLVEGTIIHFQAVAKNSGGTSLGGDESFIVSPPSFASNQLGFSNAPSAGIGATVYLPIAVELVGDVTVTSLQFRVEVTPNGSAPPISSLSLLPVTTNDFIQFVGPSTGDAPVNFNLTPYPTATAPYSTASSNGLGLFVFAGPESGMSIENFGVVGLLSFQIPYTATTNETYDLAVLYPSGSVADITALNQTLTVTDVPYLAGDSFPATGYEAGGFGDGVLDNNDVVNAIYASMGVRVPPLYSDAFNAMDVYPQTPTENGDGLIQFQDWNTILLRSVGLESPNWIRYWTNLGELYGQTITNGLPGDPFTAGSTGASKVTAAAPGMVWLRQASIGADSAANLVPGNICSLPVYAKVMAGCSLSGFQFRAIVSANGNAPPVGEVQFNPAQGIPSPVSLVGMSANDILEAWELGAFTTPLQNSNYLGTITFQIPPGATAGQSYAVHFTGVDGAPDSANSYTMESFPGYAWVLAGPPQPASITSDEWKLHFFGSLTSSLAGDDVDADGDGALNWQEYLAGTNPNNPLSVLKLSGTGSSTNGVKGITLSWLTAPGKTYILESIPAFGGKGWTAINTNEGNGYTCQFNQNNNQGTAKFYRILLQP